MKNTKLFLGVLIAALVLGFASCKQEAQDVNVISNSVKSNAKYYYTISGTYNATSTATAEVVTGYAEIEWDDTYNTNGTKYAITAKYNHKLATATAYASGEADISWGKTIYKIGSKYYEEDTVSSTGEKVMLDVSSRISGNINGTWTYTFPATTTAAGYAITFTKR